MTLFTVLLFTVSRTRDGTKNIDVTVKWNICELNVKALEMESHVREYLYTNSLSKEDKNCVHTL
jgi:PAB1-binding protein PBP1